MEKLAQGNLANNLRQWYRNHINIPLLNRLLKILLRFAVNTLAYLGGMRFPQKYDWDWKLEMLLQKYEKETTALVKKIIKPGTIIIDIGAHVGYYTRIFSKFAGKKGVVYAFEPEEENFNLLKKNVKNLKNVKIIKKALSDRDGFIDFYIAPNHTGLHSILSDNSRQNKTRIMAQTLDNFIKEEKIQKVDLIKMDIEGGEPFALAGAKGLLNQPSLMIIMEFTPSNFSVSQISPVDFLQNLSGLGFTIYKIKNQGELESIQLKNLDIKELMAEKESINLFLKK